MTSLAVRKNIIDLKFLYKIVNGLELLSSLNLMFLNVELDPKKTFYIQF